ncbi:hypothetical protein HUJ04_005494 [Dendroctonus ponderosae]|nr:hypothetical protein HUJ04_005494 [Dendroctonus ponderosae]
MEDVKEAEARKSDKRTHPFQTAGIFSKIFFTWMLSLFVKGFKKDLLEEDLYPHLPAHESTYLGDKLEREWAKELKRNAKEPSLWRALSGVFGKQLLVLACCYFFSELFVKLGQPLFLSKLLEYYEPGSSMSKSEAYYYAAGIALCSFITQTFQHSFMLHNFHLGMKIRVATSALVYRKALRLSKGALAETTVGQMVNLISNDVGRFELVTTHIHSLWMAPVETSVVLTLIYFYVGPTGMIGVLLMFLFIPLQMWMGKKTSEYRLATALRTDERIRLMNEIIGGMQVIKMYTWEKPFAKLVEFTRRREIQQIKKISIIRGIMMSFNLFLNRSSIYICVVTYVLTGSILNAQYVYVLQSLYGVLRMSVTMFFPQGITQVAEANISVKRLKKFLLYEEVAVDSSATFFNGIQSKEQLKSSKSEGPVGIHMNRACFKWIKSRNDNTLQDIDVQVGAQELAAIIGPVGSGKTTLLHAILGELVPLSGTVQVTGKVSYASQEPWLFVGSVRQNITFGQNYDARKYHEVVRVCQLQRDFSLFPYGDRTVVGERGVSLSGGQRARINLARAVYKDADIYLLDDPLSAVDAHVGKQMFEECITGYLKNKCVILVTHQLQYLKNVQKIYLFGHGKIDRSGTYEQLQNAGTEFTQLLNDLKDIIDDEEPDKEEEPAFVDVVPSKRLRRISTKEVLPKEQDKEQKLEKESRGEGTISWTIYKSYFVSGGHWCKILTLFIIFVMSQGLGSLADYFLTVWVNMNQLSKAGEGLAGANSTAVDLPVFQDFWINTLNNDMLLTFYSAIIFLLVTLTIGRSLAFYRFCNKASVRLHNNMFNKIVHGTMRFFNVNPSGRILNRFSKDMNQVDEVLPMTLLDTLQISMNVCFISIVVASVNPWMMLPTVIMLTIFYFLRVVFLATSRNIKRLEGISKHMLDKRRWATTRSPVYSHLTASLQGLTTIRAFGAQEILKSEFDNYQNAYSSAYFMFLGANRTFGFWLDMHCVIFISLVTLSFLVMDTETMGGNVGLAITQAIQLTGMFQWGMRQWSELENTMTCVERIKEYADVVPEQDPESEDPPAYWPNEGGLRFEDLSLRYASGEDLVLKNLTFEVKSAEKVGIVGRTGAGKSSIIIALFRLAINEGRIIVDGLDTAKVSFRRLRSSISIIPQEPVLFSGTLRKNLDPFDEYSDEVLWNSLEQVELKPAVSELPQGLESRMSEGGSNFSVGQRQLVCLARAIVRKNKILVLDEATANVDPHTDALIQTTIRDKFASCTVLTIAHRLHTIMDSDKVLVMDAGRVVEFGHPHELLLKKEAGVFYDLVQQTGKAMAENLAGIAEEVGLLGDPGTVIEPTGKPEVRSPWSSALLSTAQNALGCPIKLSSCCHNENPKLSALICTLDRFIRGAAMESVEKTKSDPKSHPYLKANVFSKVFFIWTFPLFKKGLKRDLLEEDLYPSLASHDSSYLGDKLQLQWQKQMSNKTKNPSLWRALVGVFGKQMFLLGLAYLAIEVLVRLTTPLFLAQLLKYYEPDSSMSKTEAYYYATGIVACTFLSAAFQHTYMLHNFHLGMKIRVATSALIYRKALRLSKSALAETTVGQMVNLISNDVGRFEMATVHLHNIWLAPLETLIVLILMYFFVGPTGMIGILFLLAFVPYQIMVNGVAVYMGKKTSIYRLATAIKTDERIRLMNEIISGIQVIKMYTWEKPFAKLVEISRKKEMEQIKKISVIRAILTSFSLFVNSTAIYSCILAYALTGNVLNAQYVYILQSFYGILRFNLTVFFPQGITQFAEANISVNRIRQFLTYQEVDFDSSAPLGRPNENSHSVGIFMKNACIRWVKSSPENNLENLNVQVGPGELAVVIGPVGSGKTTLLHGVLQELVVQSGTISVKGRTSYASQEPWLFVGSVRQNILFGQPFASQRYHEVVKVCQLQRDFSLFPYGDQTIVGERGVSLSGGQRARINLARAVYKEADIYLLDDPLSAVDAHVGKQLFEECIIGYLKNKCVILVTHQLQYLKNVQKIYLLGDNRIEQAGTYAEIQQSGKEFTKLLNELKDIIDDEEEVEEDVEDDVKPLRRRRMSTKEVVPKDDKVKELAPAHPSDNEALSSSSSYQHWKEKAEAKGRVNMNQIKNSPSHVETAFQSFWLTTMTDHVVLIAYTVLIGLVIVLTVGRSLAFYRFCNKASVRLHNSMFFKIVHATMRFFNTNTSGRILNRFSKDMNLVDEVLPLTLLDTLQISLNVIAITVLVATVNPWMLLPTVVILGIFYGLRVVFLATSRDVKRLEAITRSPVYSHLTASLQGLTTIRAFGAQAILNNEFDHYQNAHSSAYFMFLAANRSFGFWLDMYCVIFVALVTFSFLFLDTESFSGNVGLAITQSVSLTGMFQWGMRQWSELENSMTCVERIKEYADVVPEQNPDSKDPPVYWPTNGGVRFEKLSLKYSPREAFVLKNLTFEVKRAEKVGIVGRTGAGKSSIIIALFRLAINEGRIIIDGLDTAKVSFRRLRSSISIIPQEPVLFSGTLRKNLDPFDEFSDQCIWGALEEVELKAAVSSLPQGLESRMSEGGSNFSVGQRQLLCLARAIVRKNKILVLDEATANVDPQTDALIQQTIRRKFRSCTVLTIAHRLHTIMDSDKVLVMDAGRVVEFGHPHQLLLKEDGVFFQLVQQTGKAMAENLSAIAEECLSKEGRLPSGMGRHHLPEITHKFQRDVNNPLLNLCLPYSAFILGIHPGPGRTAEHARKLVRVTKRSLDPKSGRRVVPGKNAQPQRFRTVLCAPAIAGGDPEHLIGRVIQAGQLGFHPISFRPLLVRQWGKEHTSGDLPGDSLGRPGSQTYA